MTLIEYTPTTQGIGMALNGCTPTIQDIGMIRNECNLTLGVKVWPSMGVHLPPGAHM